ncbi:MAG: hypothetical protein LIO75_05375 [Lachnospiraceae bacterium]|nr:hypothetical protein [Lachnospiraceae bacterium]
MADHLIIDDAYVQEQASYLKAGLSDLNSVIDRYIACLNNLAVQSIREGATAEALRVYIGYAKQIQGHLEEIGANTSSLMQSYLTAIDEADQYLF